MVQLENLQLAANVATAAVSALGPLLNNHLQDVPVRVQEITLHSIHRGVAMALAASQVQTGLDLRTMEPGFSMADNPGVHEDLIEDFEDNIAAIVDITSAQDIISKVFN